ncbi:uncharacterized protein LOC119585609 isoform X1 [Penaeus monodon]|uniref:uncharacterized protein LOC119585609 isoform X1 n=1 Tax=Penaeus monodon TaxID=6687 RepID=UPI0018A761F3|nr:uncharacterized protein LOC119585609 isoform X1 [Penaeus monodon]
MPLQGERGGHTIWGQHSIYLENLGNSASIPQSPVILTGEEEKPPVRIIPETPPSPIQSPVPPPSQQKHLVKVSADFPQGMEHDFLANSRLCCLEFVLLLYNCTACQLSAHLNLCPEGISNSNGTSSSHIYSPQASTRLLYVGGTVRKISLVPWGCSKVPVRALVTTPGTYSLGNFTLTALRSHATVSESPVVQNCQLQTAVTVRQAVRVDHHHHNT